MVELAVKVKTIEASKTSDETNFNSQVTFGVNSSINEVERGPGVLGMKFSIDIDTQPAAAKVFVSGAATLTGKDEEIEELLNAKEADGSPVLFMRIYQKVYAMVYLVAGSLDIPYPAPGLLKVNSVATAQA